MCGSYLYNWQWRNWCHFNRDIQSDLLLGRDKFYLHLTTTTTINFKSIDCSQSRAALQIQFHNNGASSSSLVFSFPLHFTFSQVWPGGVLPCGIFGPRLWPSSPHYDPTPTRYLQTSNISPGVGTGAGAGCLNPNDINFDWKFLLYCLRKCLTLRLWVINWCGEQFN